jgi:transcriptional regulator with XRE-family HTH domain
MKNKETALLPKLRRLLEGLGENIKYARLRRKYSAEQVAERANMSRNTLWQIEKGSPSVSMGSYAQVLFVLGLEKDLELLGKDDVLGRKLQDAELKVSARAPKQKKKPNHE